MSQPRIQVWETTSLGLILLVPSGVRISNQTGGYACLHPEAEGVYVPLQTQAHGLEQFFVGSHRNSNCSNGIDTVTAKYIDDFLLSSEHGNVNFLRVDRTRLSDSHEAWIYVLVTEPQGDPTRALVSQFGSLKSVLTWQNSD